MVELLAVCAAILVLTAVALPAFNAIKGARDLTTAAYEIQGALQLARTYAIANSTYTWVGIFEEDAKNPGLKPAQAGIGRIVISIVASRDGTPTYNRALISAAAAPATQALTSTALTQIGKLIRLDNIHIYKATGNSGSFASRPGERLGDVDRVGLYAPSDPLIFQFQYPLQGTAQYLFGNRTSTRANGIIQFNPQGEAISDSGPTAGVAPCKEIAIRYAHNGVADSAANVAAVDICGLTGQATIYQR